MSLRQVLTIGVLPFIEIRNSIQTKPVNSHSQPKIDSLEQGFANLRIVVIEVRLVGIKAVPIVGLRHRIPGPIRSLEVAKDDASLFVAFCVIAPYIKVTQSAPRSCP